MAKIGVVGSISTDFVVEANRRPQQGETIFGESFGTSFGGKGANQAVASARLGAETLMIGAVGEDEFASLLLDNLKDQGINTEHVKVAKGQPSGSAVITLVDGDNSIIYVAGANGEVEPGDISEAVVKSVDIMIVQNETPVETIEYLVDLCHRLDTPIILNPAPAREISDAVIDNVTYLTPNETEFKVLFPGAVMEDTLRDYPNKLIVTLGSKGAVFFDGHELQRVASQNVANVLDTTGAGDTFNGALAFAIASGLDLVDSVGFANLAASLSIQGKGAQSAMPTFAEMKAHESFHKGWNFA